MAWVSRMRLESLAWPCSSFVTLTYDDEHCPYHLLKSDLQLFFKRLRHSRRDYGVGGDFRYFACGEYGKLHLRPHYHAVIFGLDLLSDPWLPYQVGFSGGYPVYSSRVLSKVWRQGYVTVDRATSSNMRYVAKYVTKSADDYAILSTPDVDDGRELAILDFPPFALYSQGLGRSLFVNVSRRGRTVDISLRSCFRQHYADGFIVLPDKRDFTRCSIPSSLDRYAERCDTLLYESVRRSRRDYALFSCFDVRSPMARERYILHQCATSNKERPVDNET